MAKPLQIASDAGLARRSALARRTLAIENGCVSPDLMLMRSNYRVRRAMANPDRQTDLNGQQDAVGRLPTELRKRHPTPAGFSATGELERRSNPQRRRRTVAGDAVAFVVPGDDFISRGKQTPQLLP